MFETLTLGSPYFLLFIPLFILLNHYKAESIGSFYMPHTHFLETSNKQKNHLNTFLKWLMLASAVFALSNPMYYTNTTSVKQNAIDIVLALDTSGSMSMYGFNPNAYKQTRLDVAKEVVKKFIVSRINDRVGLVVFGTRSSIVSPLTFDTSSQKHIVENLHIGLLGKSTAVVDALVSSTMLLKHSPSASKVIILLSDGEDSSSTTPLPIALKLLKKYGIKVYTVIIDKSASNMMKIIAKESQTKPYHAKDKESLTKVYDDINTLEKSMLNYLPIRMPQPLYMYFLALALFVALVRLVLYRSEKVW